MTTKHTPGPWRIDEYRNFVTPDGPLYLGGVTTPLTLGANMRKGWENARRIVACVNACEGIGTEQLESWLCMSRPILQSMKELKSEADREAKQRDDLLDALQEMVAGDAEAIEDAKRLGVPFPDEMLAAYHKARAAIAKATGEQP